MRLFARSRSRLTVEALETRDVPAGNIIATLSPTGVLTLTGDNFGNGIERLTVRSGNVTVDPDATTTVNGGAVGAPITLTGHTVAVTAILKGGADELRIDPSVDFVVSGVALFDLGDGDNTLALEQDLATQELLRIGTLLVRAGDGFDTVSVRGSFRGTFDDPGGPQFSMIRSIAFNFGDGGSDTTLAEGYLGSVPGLVTITGGDGREEVHLQQAALNSSLVVAGGPGVVRVSGLGSGLGLSITGQDVEFDVHDSSFGGFPGAYPVNIVGNASATVTLDGVVGFFSPVTVQALRRDGVVTVDVVGTAQVDPAPFASFVVKSGGSASFIVRPGGEFEINGRVGVTAGLGEALVQVDAGRMLVNGPMSVASVSGNARVVQSGTVGTSLLRLRTFVETDPDLHGAPANFNLSAFKNAELELAGGQAEFGGSATITGQTSGRLIQSGPDTTTLVQGALRVVGAASEARLDVTGNTWTGKGTTVVSSPGQAVLNLAAATTGRLEGSVTVTGGSGLDDLTATATARFLKNLSVTLGASGGHVALEPGATVGGALTVTGGTGVDDVSLKGITVGGATRIVTGGGKDTLEVDLGSAFAGTFFADLGSGDDAISIAQSLGSPAAVTFSGLTTILAGNGDDTLLLGRSVAAGGDVSSKVTFQATGNKIDGGAGVNLFDDEAAQFELVGTATLTTPNWTDPTP